MHFFNTYPTFYEEKFDWNSIDVGVDAIAVYYDGEEFNNVYRTTVKRLYMSKIEKSEKQNEQSWTADEIAEYANSGDFGLSSDELEDLMDGICGY